MPLNFKNLEQRMLDEFNRLRQLEGGIDEAPPRGGVGVIPTQPLDVI